MTNNDGVQPPFTDAEIRSLFDRFSSPITKPCITSRQKQNALGISKILWLRLVTATDTEENIYNDLRCALSNNHDSNVAFGSMYFFKMKPGLVDTEIQKLQEHYREEHNFNRLADFATPGRENSRRGRTRRASRRRSRGAR